MMQAVVTLELGWRVHNWMRSVSLELHQKHGIEMNSARNAPHLSLRSGFEVEDLGQLERYCARLAASLEPLTVTLTDLRLWANPGQPCVLFLDVAEQDLLRPLHHKITRDLGLPLNPHDGDDFHFHATVMWEPLSPAQLEAVRRGFVGRTFNQQITAHQLAVYLKTDQAFHTTHLILPLGAAHADVSA